MEHPERDSGDLNRETADEHEAELDHLVDEPDTVPEPAELDEDLEDRGDL